MRNLQQQTISIKWLQTNLERIIRDIWIEFMKRYRKLTVHSCKRFRGGHQSDVCFEWKIDLVTLKSYFHIRQGIIINCVWIKVCSIYGSSLNLSLLIRTYIFLTEPFKLVCTINEVLRKLFPYFLGIYQNSFAEVIEHLLIIVTLFKLWYHIVASQPEFPSVLVVVIMVWFPH